MNTQQPCPWCNVIIGREECICPKGPPFNKDAHNHLVDLGYKYIHHECSFEDIGDAENGPELTGDPTYDEYQSDTDYLIIEEDGRFVHWELRDLEAEKAFGTPSEEYLLDLNQYP